MDMPAHPSLDAAMIKSKWLGRALFLAGLTIAYNLVEAVVALWSGGVADSIALIGFGLDSVIESVAAILAFWRIRVELRRGDRHNTERAETILRRVVGATFLALAAYVTLQALITLWRVRPPEESLPGIYLAVASAIVMPALAWGKIIAADHIGSRGLRAEARETIACSLLSVILLFGLGMNAWLGWWWADPAAALLMVPWLVKEGREGLAGEACEDCHP